MSISETNQANSIVGGYEFSPKAELQVENPLLDPEMSPKTIRRISLLLEPQQPLKESDRASHEHAAKKFSKDYRKGDCTQKEKDIVEKWTIQLMKSGLLPHSITEEKIRSLAFVLLKMGNLGPARGLKYRKKHTELPIGFTIQKDGTIFLHSKTWLGKGSFLNTQQSIKLAIGEKNKLTISATAHQKLLKRRTKDEVAQLEKEVKLQKAFTNRHVVQIEGVLSYERGELENIAIYAEKCDGTLASYMGGMLSFQENLSLASDFAKGISTLHAKKFMHCDIKPDNLFVVKEDGKLVGKLGDFGLITEEGKEVSQSCRTYRPPEQQHAREMGQPFIATQKTDVFQFGVVLYELFHKSIRREDNLPEVSDMGLLFKDWPFDDGDVRGTALEKLIKKCLSHDPDLRPTIEQVKEELKRIAGMNSISEMLSKKLSKMGNRLRAVTK